MYRDGKELRTQDHVNFILNHGAIGDMIASLPAIRWARQNHTPDMTMAAWVAPYQVELVRHLIGQPGLDVQPISDFKAVLEKGSDKYAGPAVMNSTFKDQVTRNRTDLVAYSYMTLLDRQIEDVSELNYVSAPLGPQKIGGDYVVIPVGSTNEASVFHAHVMGPYLEWLLARGLRPVLVGKRGKSEIKMLSAGKHHELVVSDKVNELSPDLFGRCLDLRNKTTLLELRDILGHARLVAGVDGGTLHLAGTTDVPIVYACTRVDPKHRGITRDDEPNKHLVHVTPRDLECAGCQSNWTLMFKFNFAQCGYDDYACTKLLHPDDFIEASEILLNETE